MKKILGIIIVIIVISCNNNSKVEKKISGIHVEVKIDRFDEKFAKATTDSLPGLKSEYPYLFPEQFTDSVWVAKMKDTLQQELSEEVLKIFPEVNALEAELHSFFQHIKYYFPDFDEPQVITVTSDVDYKNSVIYADTLLLIGLDNYLGEDHRFYEGIYKYVRKNFKQEQMVVDVAAEVAKSKITRTKERTFLAQMILYGKELYVKDLLIPFKSNAQKIGYTDDEYKWAEENESEIWKYFVENELLFSTDGKLPERFILPAPYSKFYLELDNESPGRVGQYIGWQIVKAFMKNNNVSLQQMLRMNAEEIFNRSRFKPKK
ncbi:gliding motility lipoprotein GldB [Abyssalbus ytuae]|uniref:Gliding motility lipoprotein GldB n=1 Tax=Abyssalbus ytuae TaxID=2926907 RepID=A0A9E7A0B4_9FLAO|nr:gliding motility lipoprotein GldB [Abyssalbus ytuae]UOB18502.1 gliding motility lipoprotein GldB [Abyssalbus ytuae]